MSHKASYYDSILKKLHAKKSLQECDDAEWKQLTDNFIEIVSDVFDELTQYSFGMRNANVTICADHLRDVFAFPLGYLCTVLIDEKDDHHITKTGKYCDKCGFLVLPVDHDARGVGLCKVYNTPQFELATLIVEQMGLSRIDASIYTYDQSKEIYISQHSKHRANNTDAKPTPYVDNNNDEIKLENDTKTVDAGNIYGCDDKKELEALKRSEDAFFSSLNQFTSSAVGIIAVACFCQSNIERIQVLKYLEFCLRGGICNVNDILEGELCALTTMHVAALFGNIEAMKILIKWGFDEKRLINRTFDHKTLRQVTVFLLLCARGDVKCLNYLLKKCKHIDIFATDDHNMNGLYYAVIGGHKLMVEYLLTNVYQTPNLKQTMMNQIPQPQNSHISHLAARLSTTNALEIFKLLVKHGCNLNYDNKPAIMTARVCSPMIFKYMMENELYPSNLGAMELIKLMVDIQSTMQIARDWFEAILIWLLRMNVWLRDIKLIFTVCGLVFKIVLFFILAYILSSGNSNALWYIILFDKMWIVFKFGIKQITPLIPNYVSKDWWKELIELGAECHCCDATIRDAARFSYDFDDFENILTIEYVFELYERLNLQRKWLYYECDEGHLMDKLESQVGIETLNRSCVGCGYNFSGQKEYGCLICCQYVCLLCYLTDTLKRKKFSTFETRLSEFNVQSQKKIVRKLCKKSPLLLYWIWNGKIVLPFASGVISIFQSYSSLQFVCNANKDDINCIFNIKSEIVKNQTLLNMIDDTPIPRFFVMKFLASSQFDFAQLGKLASDLTGTTPLMKFAGGDLRCLKIYIDIMNECNTPINQRDLLTINEQWKTALHYAVTTRNFELCYYFITRLYVPLNLDSNHDSIDESIKLSVAAINAMDKDGNTAIHIVCSCWSMVSVESLRIIKLLSKYGCDFNIYNNNGRLPIHIAAGKKNCCLLLSIIDNGLCDDINVRTKNKRFDQGWAQRLIGVSDILSGNHNINRVDYSPLDCAIENQSVACVELLCQQRDVIIDVKQVKLAVETNNADILRCIICTLFKRNQIDSWESIANKKKSCLISVEFMRNICFMVMRQYLLRTHPQRKEDKCALFLRHLYKDGYMNQDYQRICSSLHYVSNVQSALIGPTASQITIPTSRIPHSLLTPNASMLDPENWDKQTILGSGGFGEVILAQSRNCKYLFALKTIELTPQMKKHTELIESEIMALEKVNHENIVQLLEYKLDPNAGKVCLALEYCQFGGLFDLFNIFEKEIAYAYFCQLISALDACHSNDIVHRDLKPSNVLLSSTFQIKIADFGLASILSNDNNDNADILNVGTHLYKAPELLVASRFQEYKNSDPKTMIQVLKACDVFSLSILLWEMMNGANTLRFTIHGFKCSTNLDELTATDYQYIANEEYDKFWRQFLGPKMSYKCAVFGGNDSRSLRDLFQKMFVTDPLKRITIKDIFDHDWIQSMKNITNKELELKMRSKYVELQHQQRNILQTIIEDNEESKYQYDQSTHVSTSSSSGGVQAHPEILRDTSDLPCELSDHDGMSKLIQFLVSNSVSVGVLLAILIMSQLL